MIRLLLLTALVDLSGDPFGGMARPAFGDAAGAAGSGVALWLTLLGLTCMTTACGGLDCTLLVGRLSGLRVLA